MNMDRRAFLATTTAAAMAGVSWSEEPKKTLPDPSPKKLPRWRGVNLQAKFNSGRPRPFRERDFEWLAEWGMDFVRLPLNYRCWSSPDDWKRMDERQMKEIDDAVEYGRQHGIHVNLNFHRAPGYATNSPDEKLSLWKDEAPREACAWQWARFAERYKGRPSRELSFNLLNEPHDIDADTCARVCKILIAAIREVDPGRLIIADGMRWAREPISGLFDAGVAQGAHCYDPMRVTHWKAPWVAASMNWPKPTWPLPESKHEPYDKASLLSHAQPWRELAKRGVGVHIGEFGCHNQTPHEVALAWMSDVLGLMKDSGWGWALWGLTGSFGFIDSGRPDVEYEDWRGHKLDRKMLELLLTG